MAGVLVQLRNVTVRLGGQVILEGISATLEAGGIHCVVGPNGGGKTTLMRTLLGQMAHEGEIVMAGEPGFVVGYAPQSIELDRSLPLTVRDVMVIMNQKRPVFLGSKAEHRGLQERALELVGLFGKQRKLFGALSGGERQRLLFAQALVPEPDLLLLDEATANMDKEGVGLVEGVLTTLKAAGKTVIWINHDWEQVRRLADTILFVNRTASFSRGAENRAQAVLPLEATA